MTFALPAFLLAIPAPCLAADFFAAHVVPHSGIPLLIRARGPKVLIKAKRPLRPGDRLRTGPGDRALVRLSDEPGCRFLLEGESILDIIRPESPRVHKAHLRRGAIWYQEMSCGVTVDLGTPVARLRGRNSVFWVQATEGATTVVLKLGDLRLLVRGQTIPLRAMTRTTISRSGSHRIASIVEREFRNRTAFPIPSRGRLPSGGISSVSAPERP